MELLRGVLAAVLARALVEALRRWGGVEAGAEVEEALVAWVAHTADLACLLLAEALRARRARRS